MKILSVDSSSLTASAAVTENGKVLSEGFINNGLTHSQTLMPLVEEVLSNSGIKAEEIDAFAVTHGPGSFTGVRIGIAAVKGMADALSKPCVAVSSLEAAAQPFYGGDKLVCSVMDARCGQVYTACFSGGKRLSEDIAVSSAELCARLCSQPREMLLTGDGAEKCFEEFKDKLKSVAAAEGDSKYVHASSVGFIAGEKLKKGEITDSGELVPFYLRLPQAERELKKKKENLK